MNKRVKLQLSGIILGVCVAYGVHSETVFEDTFDGNTFAYTNGPIAEQNGWEAHSGSGGAEIADGEIRLSESGSADVSHALENAPFSSGALYAGFSLTCEDLPGETGSYFGHFRNNGRGYAGRIWTSTANAEEGKFRLGIANYSDGDAASGQMPVDLIPNETYRIVVKYDVESGESSIWLNPSSPDDEAVVATDEPNAIEVTNFSFRQGSTGSGSSGQIGSMRIDNLSVGTTFNDVVQVVPEQSSMSMIGIGLTGMIVSGATIKCKNAGNGTVK
ncbi:MAG: hypothetical protein K9N48_02940 [Verrucomicrobia bacterium]|nr:hypothetical protein [Verrucomicrobiota bacterium]MCF7708570.1 hypothetical protein [Verrucomicrobiota bacterium]